MKTSQESKIAVVIPCYKVSRYLKTVIEKIGPEVSLIYCIDDACPENSAAKAKQELPNETRLHIIAHSTNQGVGAAVMTGYRAAIEQGADIIVKLDGDGQMDPAFIPHLIEPIINGKADYVKGNRFYHLRSVKSMPWPRVIGNAGVSFLSKISTGYWNIFDPTNGFTAIHSAVVRQLPLEKIHRRFFFESDILFQLNLLRAVILEVPMDALYADEKSNLNPWKAFGLFPLLHIRNFFTRLVYNYFLRNFSLASLDFLLGCVLFLFGVIFGLTMWITNAYKGVVTTSGTVMISALPIILGFQLLLGFLSFDMSNIPDIPVHKHLRINKLHY